MKLSNYRAQRVTVFAFVLGLLITAMPHSAFAARHFLIRGKILIGDEVVCPQNLAPSPCDIRADTPVAGVRVVAETPKGKVKTKARTNSRGEFVLRVPKGTYNVRAIGIFVEPVEVEIRSRGVRGIVLQNHVYHLRLHRSGGGN